jgi:hypothetical protein
MNNHTWKAGELCKLLDDENDRMYVVCSTHLLPEELIVQEIAGNSSSFEVDKNYVIPFSTVEKHTFLLMEEYISIALGVNIEFPIGSLRASERMVEIGKELINKL